CMGVNRWNMGGCRRWGTAGLPHLGWPLCNLGHSANLFFHFLARLEGHDVLRFDFDLGTSPGIPGLSRLASFDLENAKISQFDSAVLNQRFDDSIKRPLNDFFSLQLGEIGPVGDLL